MSAVMFKNGIDPMSAVMFKNAFICAFSKPFKTVNSTILLYS